MKQSPAGQSFVLLLACALLPGCALMESMKEGSASRAERKHLAEQREAASAEHDLFRTLGNWKSSTFRNKDLLAKASPENVSLRISLGEQRGLLLVDGAIAMDFPVATGKKSHPTPAGQFKILSKEKNYASNLYGKIYDVEGTVVVADADTRTDVVPEGGYFVGSTMPYWMRLTGGGVGLHVGYVPGRPASHGCIRLKADAAKELFALTKTGTPVEIVE